MNAPRSDAPSIWTEIARADLRLRDLVASLPSYARMFTAMWRSPRVIARTSTSADAFRPAFLFLTQGLTLGFAISMLAVALPAYLVDFQATRLPLLFESREAIVEASRRVSAVETAIAAPATARAWLSKPELVLLVRKLPPPRFEAMVDRLREVSVAAPRVLEEAIAGRFAGAGAADPRTYLRSYFIALRPSSAHALRVARPELAGAPPRWSVKPALTYLVQFLVLWFVGASIAWRVLARHGGHRTRTYIAAAYAVGFAAPLWELASFARNVYSAATIGAYVSVASAWMTMPATASLIDLAREGLFSFENALLAGLPPLVRGAIVITAARHAQAAFASSPGVSNGLAWQAAALAIAAAAGSAELISGAIVAILAPIGLL